MATTTSLFLLLDGILSQDHAQTMGAMQTISQLLQSRGTPLLLPSVEPLLTSAFNLSEIVRQLLNACPEMASIPSPNDGSLPIHFAASIGNVQAASYIVEKFPQGITSHNVKGKLPLHYAAREGRTDMVAFLLRLNPQIAAVASGKDKLAIHFAAGEGHLEMVRILLRVYPQGGLRPSKKGKLPLHFAARWGHLQVAQELLRVAPNSIAEVDWEGSLPLHEAAREGQYRMCKFLMERYPAGLCKANMRGEIPLFPAVRTNNLELVILFLRAWPRGGKHILQTAREDDNVSAWNPKILELCLRGAVENWAGCDIMKKKALPPYYWNSSTVDRDHRSHIAASSRTGCEDEEPERCVSSQDTPCPACDGAILNDSLEISLPRSKSPILGQMDGDRKKRPSSGPSRNGKKRRSGCCPGDESLSRHIIQRPFFHLHAAIECQASAYVVRCTIDQYSQQLSQADEFEQFPLHKAVACCRRDDEIDIVVNHILAPCPWVAKKRDIQGRLPLHVALKARADFRVIQPLLEANAAAGVDLCMVNDHRFQKVPPIVMASEVDCDLSTVYTLLRADPSIVDIKIEN